MDYNILLNQGIKPEDCASIEIISDKDDTFIFVKLKPSQRICKNCGLVGTKIKEYKSKTVHTLPTGKNRTTIVYSVPRYVCPVCGKTYTHNLSEYSYKSVSSILKNKLLSKFAEIVSFKSIAKEYDYSENEILNLFDKLVPNIKHKISDAICIDETTSEFVEFGLILSVNVS